MQAFISHNTCDSEFAEEIGSYLRDTGIDVWLDSWAVGAGDSIVQSVNRGLELSDVVVVLLSQRSVGSKWVEKEWNAKFSNDLESGKNTVITVCIEPPDSFRIPALLKDKKYIQILPDNRNRGLLLLAAAILKTGMPVSADLFRAFLLGFYAVQLAGLSVLYKNTGNYARMKQELYSVIAALGLRDLDQCETSFSIGSLELLHDAVKPLGTLAESAYTLGYSDMSIINAFERDDLSSQERSYVLSRLLGQIEQSLLLLSLHHWFVDYKRVVNDSLAGSNVSSPRCRIEQFRPKMVHDLRLCGAH